MSPPPPKEVVFPGTQKNTNWDEIIIGEGVHLNHLGSKLYFPSIKGGIIGDETKGFFRALVYTEHKIEG